ncbi:MAG: aldo/keto reductase, partial [Pseudomonadota bacterium]
MNVLETMPKVGFGLWKIPKEDTASSVVEAIRAGYRHFDSAADYANEAQTGEGLAQAMAGGLVSRDDLWITSKLWNTFHASEHVEMACRKTLADLQLDQLDLYLIHFPIALEFVPIEERYPPEWLRNPDAAEPRMHPARVPLH